MTLDHYGRLFPELNEAISTSVVRQAPRLRQCFSLRSYVARSNLNMCETIF